VASSLKGVLTIVWNTDGFHAVDMLPKGATFDIDDYCEDILSETLRASPARSNRLLVLHADKRIHGKKQPKISPASCFLT
jgi:hypothetical protein